MHSEPHTPVSRSSSSGSKRSSRKHRWDVIKTCRLVVLGAPRVGKTSIIKKFLHPSITISTNVYEETVEDIFRQDFKIDSNAKFVLEILDTSGANAFPVMRNLAIKSGDIYLLVYSCDEKQSLETVRTILTQDLKDQTDKPVIICLNKTDLLDSSILTQQSLMVSVDWDLPFVQCSALTNSISVERIFCELKAAYEFKYGPLCSTTPKKKKSFKFALRKNNSEPNNNKLNKVSTPLALERKVNSMKISKLYTPTRQMSTPAIKIDENVTKSQNEVFTLGSNGPDTPRLSVDRSQSRHSSSGSDEISECLLS